jgi:hypothetical protein
MRYPNPEKQRDEETQKEARNIERALPAQHTPAEPVDDTHNWIETVPESPLLGLDGTRESDRRHIRPKLYYERDDEAKVASSRTARLSSRPSEQSAFAK